MSLPPQFFKSPENLQEKQRAEAVLNRSEKISKESREWKDCGLGALHTPHVNKEKCVYSINCSWCSTVKLAEYLK